MSRRDVVVIGGSRGGLDALCHLVERLPEGLPVALLAVLHTSPFSPRMLAEIVSRCAALEVSYARDGERIRTGRLYIAPPDRHLLVRTPDMLELDDGPKLRHSRPSVDRLFESAAAVLGSRVIGVVLTGGDGDGAIGLRSIKAAHGVGIVQDPDEAEAPGMPLSALQADHPDYCVRLSEIAPLIAQLTAEHRSV